MKILSVVLAAFAAASPAQAQEADWDMHRDPAKKLTMAYTQFDNGLGIAARCMNGGYEAVISGLPPAGKTDRRVLRVAFGDEDLHDQSWNVAVSDTVAVSTLPAPFARELRQGGRLRILVPQGAEDGRNIMYDLTLPASSASIDETLTTCERPLNDPRDAELDALPDTGLPINMAWARRPLPSYPTPLRFGRGFATVMCITNPDGSLRDCSIEAEHPQEGEFGEAALRATRRARITNTEDPAAAVPTARILYRTDFILDGYESREDRQRRRENREREREERAVRP